MQSPQPQSPQPHETGGVTIPGTLPARAPARVPLAGAIGIAAVTVFAWAFLHAESQAAVGWIAAAAVVSVLGAARAGALRRAAQGALANERMTGLGLALSLALLIAAFHEDHFTLLLLARVLVIAMACLGLHVQFGMTGVVNFAGAAFFGVGAYAGALLAAGPVPHLLVLTIGGAAAAVVGSVLLLPLLRTRGHYAALITIAFGLLFRTFIEVNDTLGGPQGLNVPGMHLLGWSFNDGWSVGGVELSFYIAYVVLAFLLLAAAFSVVRRLETSWVGLALDAVRLDETAAASFGVRVPRWKIGAFTLGNFIIGIAGALSGMITGYIAPNSFTFQESLVFVSIVLLGGIGNAWGLLLASFIVVVVPEKLQAIQEYRFLLYATLVIFVLVFRPSGLVPRALRRHFGGSA
jgi:ABC-type branched-subunit amino acid transport system permease subunit